ncbi:mechanosensitive ion channel family protein [Salinisphaera sp. Q1T1-3]|uniref:mechanosensitive ion channel family protein n=1 Tax=Salinisphaera sp. Q1T1-3 TaxID=2321229 RepID=UPI000E750098|nr:mechanosensitive ion channel family protein [Salinisphaera sp. Q1T1-3]RJS92042.1 mechanosensitive ion channel family protein [Salinisphaera sp. Q1T1-3]
MIDNLLQTYDSFVSQYLSLQSEWGVLIDVVGLMVLTGVIDLITRFALRILHDKVTATRNLWDDAIYRSVNGPLQILIWIGGITLAIRIATDGSHFWHPYVSTVRGVLITLAIVWFAFRLIRSIEKNALARTARSTDHLDATSADALAKLFRILVLILAGIALLEQFGVSPRSLLAFSGIGGIAVGFAARDVLANIFGGVTVYLNRPFSVGDWIRSPDRDIEGVVESIGWRATTLRRFDKRPLYVPNAVFSNVALENPSRMTHRQINETVSIRFEDAAQVADIVEAIRGKLDADETVDSNEVILTYLDSFGPSSLDLMVYCYTKTTDWAEYLAIKQSVLQQVQDTVREYGGALSLPTNVIHVPEALAVVQQSGEGDETEGGQEEIDSQKVQSERNRAVAREQSNDNDTVGPDNPGEEGS